MKFIILFLLFAVRAGCFAANDASVLAAGDWSEPATDSAGTLRGRLLLCDSPKDKSPAAYLELQECANSWGRDLDVYCNLQGAVTRLPAAGTKEKARFEKAVAVWEMRDGSNQLVPMPPSAYSGGAPGAQWVTLPCDSTVRLRVSLYAAGRYEDGSLNIFLAANHWVIPARSANDYFLSCTFTVDPPANHVTLPSHRVWRGTLKLPKMQLPVERP